MATTITRADQQALADATSAAVRDVISEKLSRTPMPFNEELMASIAAATIDGCYVVLERAKLHANAEIQVLRDEVRELRKLLAESETRAATFQRQLDRHRDHLGRIETKMQRERAT